jgi:hypothetical protein
MVSFTAIPVGEPEGEPTLTARMPERKPSRLMASSLVYGVTLTL